MAVSSSEALSQSGYKPKYQVVLIFMFLAAACIPVSLASIWLINSMYEQETNFSSKELALKSKIMAAATDAEYNEVLQSLDDLARSNEIETALGNFLMTHVAVPLLKQQVDSFNTVSGIFLLNKNKDAVRSYPQVKRSALPLRVRKVIEENREINSDIALSFALKDDTFFNTLNKGKSVHGDTRDMVIIIVPVYKSDASDSRINEIGWVVTVVSVAEILDNLASQADDFSRVELQSFEPEQALPVNETDAHQIQVVAPVFAPDDMINMNKFALIMADNISHRLIQVQRKTMNYVMVAGIGVFILFFVMYVIAKWLVRPMHDVSRVVHEYSSRNYSAEIPPATFQEFGMVLTLLYDMGNEIKAQIGQLEATNKELEEANRDLLQASKLKDEILANTSHELRTPIHGIIGIVESLMRSEDFTEYQTRKLDIVASSATRLSLLINNILDAAKLKSGGMATALAPVNIWPIVEDTIALSHSLIGAKEISAKNLVAKDCVYVLGDANRVTQILNNLISNAVKFTPSGEVEVSACEEGDNFAITVRDTGIGIPKDKLDLIFNQFEQIDSSSAREYSGTGLGLSITKQLIELLGGTISVESTEGEGTVFTVTLQKASEYLALIGDKKDQNREQQSTNVPANNVSKKTRQTVTQEYDQNTEGLILAVDDEPTNLEVLDSQLTPESLTVMRASSGEEALAMIADSDTLPALVLLDVMMPKMTGYEVCERLREQFSKVELPIILLTAKSEMKDLVKGFELGANDYITKPFSRLELIARVNHQLQITQLNRKLVKAERELVAANYQLTHEIETAKNHAKANLVHAAKMSSLGTFVAGIAHEVNNPTNFVHGGADNAVRLTADFKQLILGALEDVTSEEAVPVLRYFADISVQYDCIVDGAKRISAIVADLKTFSNDGKEDVIVQVDLNESITSIVRIVQGSLDDCHIDIETDLGEIPAMWIYSVQINQVLLNIIVNACNAIEEAYEKKQATGTIKITTAADGENTVLEIRDNGIGIAPDDLPKIYEPFFTTKPVGEGIGLGLSVAYGVIQEHKGRIRHYSENGWTVCEITLPQHSGMADTNILDNQ